MTVWRSWFEDAMRRAGVAPAGVMEALRDRVPAAEVSRWVFGGGVPAAEAAVMVALVLRRDPAGALRAAGYPLLAQLVERP